MHTNVGLVRVKQTGKQFLKSSCSIDSKPQFVHWFWELVELLIVVRVIIYSSSAGYGAWMLLGEAKAS